MNHIRLIIDVVPLLSVWKVNKPMKIENKIIIELKFNARIRSKAGMKIENFHGVENFSYENFFYFFSSSCDFIYLNLLINQIQQFIH